MALRKFNLIGAAQCQAVNKSNKQRCRKAATHQRGNLALCAAHFETRQREMPVLMSEIMGEK